MLIHATFESGMVNLYNLLVVERRVEDTVHKKNVVDIINALKELDPIIASMIDPVRGFNFIRNNYAYSVGYYPDSSTDIDAFKKLISSWDDIAVK
jgi:hypothetical protein